jgi:hypothetical protein
LTRPIIRDPWGKERIVGKKALAVAGTTGVLLCSSMMGAGAAWGAPTPAAPTPTAAAAAATGLDFTAMLAPVGANKVTGSGELWVTLTGNKAKFTLQVGGLLANAPHAGVLYADAAGKCPTDAVAAAANGHKAVTLADAAPVLGSAGTALTVSGDTGAGSALALGHFPTAGAYTYSRTFDIDPKVAASIKSGTAVMVVHGVDYNGNGKYDDVLGTSSGVPAEAAAPALCGAFVASQMASVPTGSADTGGGPADSSTALAGYGALSLLGAAGAAVVAFRRRLRGPSARKVVTNG